MQLGHLGLPVRDYERSLTFYATYFGFDPATAQKYGDGTVIVRNADGFDLALHPTAAAITAPEFLHFGFMMAAPGEVRALRQRLAEQDVPVVEEDDEPDLVSFKCLDPDGWRVEVYWERKPVDNPSMFESHPVDAVAALLPDHDRAEAALEEMRKAGIDLADVELLHGPGGIATLDERGTGHGLRAHLVRLLQKWTYYEQILLLYTAGMRHGGAVIVAPCTEERSKTLAALLLRHGARSIHYFGFERVEDLSGA
ncbi:VOC family protein [Actinoplanes sp. NPDC051343]|uniref:VOC family protein n=1 Tax=Actinoplanes sp. NPDC051343 TaxID=3363906 RepID=UPI0037B44CC2